jgi:hypothetical protein
MKKGVVFLIIIIFCFHCFSIGLKDRCLKVSVKKIRLVNENFKNPKGLFFSLYNITIIIKNISNRTIKFHQVKCSWQDYFIIDKDFLLDQFNCPSNLGTIIELKPGQSTYYNGNIIGSSYYNQTGNYKLKIGFYFVEVKNAPFDNHYHRFLKMKKDKEGIIWSKEYLIKKRCHKKIL